MMRGVLLVVVDCLRADHVSCYGYDRATTPTIDSLADQGVLWEQAFAASSWTKPSVASLLTGLYPTQHGAFRGIKRRRGRPGATTGALRSPEPTLAERFSEAGWRCGAFVNNAQLGEFTGMNRGFATYAPCAGKADRLIGIFLEWLEADLSKPFFAYLHFLEAHWPYKPRRRHVALFGGNRDTNYFRDFSARDYGQLRRAVSHGTAVLSKEQLNEMLQMYDGAVRRLDGKLRIILAMLRELGLLEHTAVIVTADHGEEFLEHSQIGHGQSLYDELIRVPLIAQGPGLPSRWRIERPVSLVDLGGTLLAAAGLDVDPSRPNLLDEGLDLPVFAELWTRRRYTQAIRMNHWKLHRRYKFQPTAEQEDGAAPPWECVANHPHRVTHELYNMIADPSEQKNLANIAQNRKTEEELTERLQTWWDATIAASCQSAPSDVEIDSEVLERLRDLGYLE